jgi:hypothetical protein
VLVKEAAQLNIASGDNAVPNRFRRFRAARIGEFFIRNSRHVHLNIDSIHQWSGNFRHVALDLRRRAEAISAEVVGEPARLRMRIFAIASKRL